MEISKLEVPLSLILGLSLLASVSTTEDLPGYTHRNGDCHTGGDLAKIDDTTVEHCVRQCNKVEVCKSILFNDNGRYCWLKRSECPDLTYTGSSNLHFYNKDDSTSITTTNVITTGITTSSDTFGTWYLNGLDTSSKSVDRTHGTSYAPQAPFGQVLHLIGNEYATIKRVDIWDKDFTMHIYMKTTGNDGQWRTIIGSWVPDKWFFIFRIMPNNQLNVALRRNGNDARPHMVGLSGGNIVNDRWYSVGFSWQRATGEAKLFINGAVVDTQRTTHTDRDLFRNSAPTFQIGYKADSNKFYFKGYLAELTISPGAASQEKMREWAESIGL